jgi:hypothetical protein
MASTDYVTKYAERQIRVAKFMIAHAEIFCEGYSAQYNGANVFVYDTCDEQGNTIPDTAKPNMVAMIRALRKAFPGSQVQKTYSDQYFVAMVATPDGDVYELKTSRSKVCTRVETGEMVTVYEPDYSQTPQVAREVPVVTWECDPLLADV